MRTRVTMLGLLAVGYGLRDPLQAFLTRIPHPLVGFPCFLGTLLVNVIGRVDFLPVRLPPGGDALVQGVGVVTPTALGQFGLTIEHVNGVVVGGVLLGGVVADGPAVVRVIAQGEFQRADHSMSMPSRQGFDGSIEHGGKPPSDRTRLRRIWTWRFIPL